MKIKCLIIDDEQLARTGITSFVGKVPFLELTASYADPLKAMEHMRSEKVDLIFLDIRMPKISGLELLKSLADPPLTVIVSAFSNHALEGYELNVIDYLLKPVPFERFVKAAAKAKDFLALKNGGAGDPGNERDYFFIRCGNRYEKINYADILVVEAMQNYVIVHTREKRYVTYLTFKAMEGHLPRERFLKVQKSYIVAVDAIDSIDGDRVKVGAHVITISRSGRQETIAAITKNKLVKRG